MRVSSTPARRCPQMQQHLRMDTRGAAFRPPGRTGMARERGLDRAQSFWYAALLSTLREYGAEALAEPVSAQDLVVTPVAGFLVGEYLFAPLRQRIRAQAGPLD